jgi:type II secretory pathway pseudopilin PulG
MSETTGGEKQGARLSRVAVLAFLSGPAGLILLWLLSGELAGTPLGIFLKLVLLIVLISPVVAMVLGIVAATRIHRSQGRLKGRGFANMGVALGFISLFLLILIPNLQTASRRSRRSIAASDAKTAVTQAIVYASDNGVYPTSIKVLREGEIVYCACPYTDRWGNDYVLSPVLTQGSEPKEGDNVYVYSRGPEGTGVYPRPFTSDTGPDGSVGYSSVHGRWGYPKKQ